MKQKIVEIEAPDGSILEVEGPDDATDDEFIDQGILLWEQLQATKADQAKKFPTAAESDTALPGTPVEKSRPLSSIVPLTFKDLGSSAKAVWDDISGTAKMLFQSPEEIGAEAKDAMTRHEQEAGKAFAAGDKAAGISHALAAAIPLLGPAIHQMSSEAGVEPAKIPGHIIAGLVLKKAGEKITPVGKTGVGEKPNPLTPNRDQINTLSTIARAGARTNVAPQDIAIASQQFFRQSLQELGVDPSKVALKERTPKTDLHGDLYRGLDPIEHAAMAQRLGKTSAQVKPLAIETANRAVEIAHRPIKSVVDKYKNTEIPEVQASVINELRARAAEYHDIDPGVEKAINTLISRVETKGGTVLGMDDLKANANKEVNRLFDRSPSAQVAATATPVFAYQILAEAIRSRMYPALEKLSGSAEGSLINAGRAESAVIQMRDGIYANWSNAAGNQATRSLKNYITHIVKGEGEFLPVTAKSWAAGAARRMMGFEHPLSQFNKAFRDGIGPIGDIQQPGLVPWGRWEAGDGPESAPGPDIGVSAGRGRTTPNPQLEAQNPTFIRATARGPHVGPSGQQHNMRGPVSGELTTGQRLLPGPGETFVRTTNTGPEAMREMLQRTDSPQSRAMRRSTGSGSYSSQARPTSLEEYIRTKGGRQMFESDRYKLESTYDSGGQKVFEYSDSQGKRFVSTKALSPNQLRTGNRGNR